MLIIISDIHLGDGTFGKSISAAAFRLLADRLKELALHASWRSDGRYRPLEQIEIVLMGDILEPLHSTRWLEKDNGQANLTRPWTDLKDPDYAETLGEITRAILANNQETAQILKDLSRGLPLPAATRNGLPAMGKKQEARVPVRIYSMIGNHDWYYHIPGPAFDAIRQEVIAAFGLANPVTPFPHESEELAELNDIFRRYRIHAQHGDVYDSFNYNKEKGRNAATIGDAFAVEVLNRFPVEAERRLGADLPAGIIDSLRELVNVRPVLATPLWISGQLRQNNVPASAQKKLKAVWDELAEQFLDLPIVREADRKFKFDLVDGLELLIRLSKRTSFQTIDEIVVWLRETFWGGDVTLAKYALKEEAFLKRTAQFIVYGHTHQHEVIPLDSIPGVPNPTNQIYLNSGTWHTYYDLALHKPKDQVFIPYQVLTYLSFYKDEECASRRFEAWSGAFSD